MLQPGAGAAEFPQNEDAVCFRETLEHTQEVLEWTSEFAVEPVMDGALGNTDHMPDLFLLEFLTGGAFYAIQGLLECANDFAAGFVICRRKEESI
jgi:hypothetical protein